MLTEQESQVLDLSGELWNKYLDLPEEHPSDREDFMRFIHALQNIILSRSAYRDLKKVVSEKNEEKLKEYNNARQ